MRVSLPRYSLALLMGVVGALGVGASLTVSISHSLRVSQTRACQSNLRMLWAGQFEHGERRVSRCCGPISQDRGGDFWLKLQRGERPVVDRYERFFCPLSGERIEPGRTSYRGPRLNVNRFADEDPVGADKEGNHGEGAGGNVLLKRGECIEAPGPSPLWMLAGRMTSE